MKICLYLEFYHFWGGRLFKNIGTGLLSSYKNQKAIINELHIPYTEKWERDCDILQINTPWLKSIYLIKKARRQKKKVIIWAHVTMEDAMAVFRFMPLVAPLFKKYLTYAYGLADLVFAPSEYTKKLLVAYGLPKNKIVTMSNGVDVKKYFRDDIRREAGRKKYHLNNITVGSIGLVIPRKGTDIFLTLAKEFPQTDFIWFGAFYSGLIVKPIPKKLPDNTQFTGYIDDIYAAYNSLDIFIFPSAEENEGMVVLEAAAMGLPILVRDIPVYNGWLVHGENCFKAKTDAEFAKYLKDLIDDKSLRTRLGRAALQLAQEKSLPAMAKKTFIQYKKLLVH